MSLQTYKRVVFNNHLTVSDLWFYSRTIYYVVFRKVNTLFKYYIDIIPPNDIKILIYHFIKKNITRLI